MSIANLSSPNPFDDNTNDTEDKGMSPANGQGIVHLRIQKRNGRKSVTTISGLPKGLKVDKVLKEFRKLFCCNGVVVEDEDGNKVIQLQGDHREAVQKFLIVWEYEEEIVSADQIQVHGF